MLAKGFLLSPKANQKKWHLIDWATITKRKSMGGLGLRNLHLMQRTIEAKQAAKMFMEPQNLWAKKLKAKYKQDLNLLTENSC